MKRFTPSTFVNYWDRRAYWINCVCNALKSGGSAQVSWSGGERDAATRLLKEVGIHIVTKRQGEKLGYTLRKSAKPIGKGYFYSPISNYGSLYVLECHFDTKDLGGNE